MGRYYEGSKLASQWKRLNINLLSKNGYLKKGEISSGEISWNDGASLIYNANLEADEKYMVLSYSVSGPKIKSETLVYKIWIDELPSNLGKGKVLYFICPSTGRRCRILYMAYGNTRFLSRFAYGKPIYYPSQLDGKNLKDLTRFYHFRNQIDRIESRKNFHKFHQGKETRQARKLSELYMKKKEAAQLVRRNLSRYPYLIDDMEFHRFT